MSEIVNGVKDEQPNEPADDSMEPSIAAQLAVLDESIVDARSKVTAAIKSRKTYWTLSGLFLSAILLNYFQIIALAPVVLAVMWVFMLMFLMSGAGADSEKPFNELQKLELRKRLYFSFLNIRTDEDYFARLVNINIENLRAFRKSPTDDVLALTSATLNESSPSK